MSEIEASDMIFSNNPEIYSGGFSVNSIMMKEGFSPIMTINNNENNQIGGNSGLFNNLVVPNWAWSLPNKTSDVIEDTIGGRGKNTKYNNIVDDDVDVVDDDLYNTLLELATENMKSNNNKIKSKKETRKQKRKNKKSNKQTKKNKK